MAFDRQGSMKEAERQLQKVLTRKAKAITKFGKEEFIRWGYKAIGVFRGKQLSGRPGLWSRTGSLRGSFQFLPKPGADGGVVGQFLTTSKYARIHEYGGIITASPGRKLAIPFPGGPAETQPGATSHQAARYTSPLRATLPKNVKFFTKTSKRGNLILFGKEGKQDAKPWFILKQSVKIPPRLKFVKTIQEQLTSLHTRLTQAHIEAIKSG